MTELEARKAVRAAIGKVAPDVDAEEINDGSRLRQDLELDSLDFLRLVEIIAHDCGLDIPEQDYPAVGTIKGLVGYLAAHG
ncbi:acyl carrier protein [Arthrobacter wenxiniae]|uniref:Acyl carrier protein n=1 Tax=Arthrobacter wenxiniae TaxID=2713570 RepID=A0A7Y7IF98_9MICC|nr:phosphopantetheine-binding protein [Arthrobacter wenxiniae]NVM94243.1 acyl carrier protein [Arthrobacter wenxiniae]